MARNPQQILLRDYSLISKFMKDLLRHAWNNPHAQLARTGLFIEIIVAMAVFMTVRAF